MVLPFGTKFWNRQSHMSACVKRIAPRLGRARRGWSHCRLYLISGSEDSVKERL